MKSIYYVYSRDLDIIPVISLSELPEVQMKSKKKYTGKKAKIEAVFRAFNELLPEDWTTQQVNEYIGANLFGTHKWKEYHSILNQVLDERILISEKYDLLYKLIVTFKDEMMVGEQMVNTNPADERIIYLVTRELIGKSIDIYQSVGNPILSIEKQQTRYML